MTKARHLGVTGRGARASEHLGFAEGSEGSLPVGCHVDVPIDTHQLKEFQDSFLYVTYHPAALNSRHFFIERFEFPDASGRALSHVSKVQDNSATSLEIHKPGKLFSQDIFPGYIHKEFTQVGHDCDTTRTFDHKQSIVLHYLHKMLQKNGLLPISPKTDAGEDGTILAAVNTTSA